MPELYRFATCLLVRYRWGEKKTTRSAVLEPDELVNRACEELLSGQRAWPPGAGKTQKSLIAVLCMTMKSIASHTRASALIAKREGSLTAVRSLEQVADGALGAEARLVAQSLIEEVREVFKGDPEIAELCEIYARGVTKREDVAKVRGWSAQKVKVAQNRMRRTLAAKGISYEGAGEPQAPEGYADRREDEEAAE